MEYASTFLMSYCFSAMVAAKNAVSTPMPATVALPTGDSAKRTEERATM